MTDYTDLQQRREKLAAENELLMGQFEAWLASPGLVPKTVRRYVDNAWAYLDYLLGRRDYEEPVLAAEGASRVDSYFSYDYIHDEYATPGMVGENVTSIKRFYLFMLDTGRVGQDDYDELLDDIRTFKSDWLDLAQRYQDWDPDSGEESPFAL